MLQDLQHAVLPYWFLTSLPTFDLENHKFFFCITSVSKFESTSLFVNSMIQCAHWLLQPNQAHDYMIKFGTDGSCNNFMAMGFSLTQEVGTINCNRCPSTPDEASRCNDIRLKDICNIKIEVHDIWTPWWKQSHLLCLATVLGNLPIPNLSFCSKLGSLAICAFDCLCVVIVK